MTEDAAFSSNLGHQIWVPLSLWELNLDTSVPRAWPFCLTRPPEIADFIGNGWPQRLKWAHIIRLVLSVVLRCCSSEIALTDQVMNNERISVRGVHTR